MTSEINYSQQTIAGYSRSITSIRRLFTDHTGESFNSPQSFANTDLIIQILQKQYQPQTVINFISAILWELNKSTDTSSIRDAYRIHGASLKQQIEHSRIGKEFELTEKEQKSFMIWEKILDMYQSVLQSVTTDNYNSFLDFVILSLYVLHPPVRADYANMKIYIEDSFVPSGITGNYCVLQTNPRFVFQQYKTAKHKGTTVVQIVPELHDILLDWMEINPTEDLLTVYVQSKKEFKPMTENGLSKRLTSIFLKHSNTPVTINTLRHSFISFVSKHDQEYSNKQQNADKMMHSMTMADRYRRMVYLP